jgi:hypothetical protein
MTSPLAADAASTITVDADRLCAAATALGRAARCDEALALLDACTPSGDGARLAVALAATDVSARRDYLLAHRGTDDRLRTVTALVERVAAQPSLRWDVALLRLRQWYGSQLIAEDGNFRIGPEGRDRDDIERALAEAEHLERDAPDAVRRGWAAMLIGWIHDNLLADRATAPGHYTTALAAGRNGGDHYLVFEAQRHLGDHAHDRGDHQDALDNWRESASAAARAGYVPGVLAQQVLLAVLARDDGDESAARAIATEAGRWAAAIGARSVHLQVTDLLDGGDPTRPPTEPTQS